MLGNAIPTNDKLACLANLLDTSSEELRFGRSCEKTFVFDGEDLSAVDQKFLRTYLSLPIKQQRLIREMITAVAWVKACMHDGFYFHLLCWLSKIAALCRILFFSLLVAFLRLGIQAKRYT